VQDLSVVMTMVATSPLPVCSGLCGGAQLYMAEAHKCYAQASKDRTRSLKLPARCTCMPLPQKLGCAHTVRPTLQTRIWTTHKTAHQQILGGWQDLHPTEDCTNGKLTLPSV
jgi:hypothetical protein